MKKISTILILSSLAFLFWSAFSPSNQNQNIDENWEAKISSQLMTKALAGEQLNFLVFLQKQKNVNAAKNLKTKEGRANYVFQNLKSHAQSEQKNILKILKNANADYQSFYVVNALHVKGDFNLLKKIAQLSEVKRLTDNSPILLEAPVEKLSSGELE